MEGSFGHVDIVDGIAVKRTHSRRDQMSLITEIVVLEHLSHINIMSVWHDVIDHPRKPDRIILSSQQYWPITGAEDYRELFNGIGHGLYYIHVRGFIHSDLKENNIMIDVEGNPVLIDFGCAFWVGVAAQITVENDHESYAMPLRPPEQMDHVISWKSDLWAFGILMFRFWFGKYLFPDYEFNLGFLKKLRAIQTDFFWAPMPEELQALRPLLQYNTINRATNAIGVPDQQFYAENIASMSSGEFGPEIDIKVFAEMTRMMNSKLKTIQNSRRLLQIMHIYRRSSNPAALRLAIIAVRELCLGEGITDLLDGYRDINREMYDFLAEIDFDVCVPCIFDTVACTSTIKFEYACCVAAGFHVFNSELMSLLQNPGPHRYTYRILKAKKIAKTVIPYFKAFEKFSDEI